MMSLTQSPKQTASPVPILLLRVSIAQHSVFRRLHHLCGHLLGPGGSGVEVHVLVTAQYKKQSKRSSER